MEVFLTHDQAHDVWTFTHDRCVLNSEEALDEWYRQVQHVLKKTGNTRVVLLVDLTNISITSTVQKRYGEMARAITEKYALFVLRYGGSSGLTAPVIQLQGVIQKFQANIYANRDEALARVAVLRQAAS